MRSNLPRYVERIRAKGRDYYYFRRGGARFRLPGAPGDTQFAAEYLQRLGAQDPAPRRVIEFSIGALMRDYKASDEYRELSASAQKGYASMLDFLGHIEHVQASQVERHHLERLSAKLRAGKKRTKKLFAQVASVVFNFGIDNGYCKFNPAARMARKYKSTAYKAWTDEECDRFELSQPPQHLFTAYMLARYAGQRRGDILKLTRAAYTGMHIVLKQGKTERHADGNDHLEIAVFDRLKRYLDALPSDRLLFVVDYQGRALEDSAFSKEFRRALDAAGLRHLHFHGLRHTCGVALAEAGCSEKEIMAVLGHKSLAMVKKYTEQAQRKLLSSAAITKMERTRTERESAKPGQ